MKTLLFFNNKGGVGKTSLVYHLAWMYRDLGVRVVAADLDPQSNLTTAFLPEERVEELWPDGKRSLTIMGAVEPLLERLGDLAEPHIEVLEDGLGLLPGDLGLSLFEDRLAETWPACLEDNPAKAHDAFRVTTAFYRTMERASLSLNADLVLIDVGPSLGAINRAVLVASDHVVVPLGADLFSLQGLRNLGPTLRTWKRGWQTRRSGNLPEGMQVPRGDMRPIGYVVLQDAVRHDRPVKAYRLARIPQSFRTELLGEVASELPSGPDPYMLATLKHYRSLMPLARDARKPMFYLKPADGAIGGHAQAVQDCYRDFEHLARAIAQAAAVIIPAPAGR